MEIGADDECLSLNLSVHNEEPTEVEMVHDDDSKAVTAEKTLGRCEGCYY